MTMEDLNWVQSRLRNCTNARRQLRICAECLCVDEGTLLESLGYASLDAFRAAHPQGKPGTNIIERYVLDDALTLDDITYNGDGSVASLRVRKRDGSVITWQAG